MQSYKDFTDDVSGSIVGTYVQQAFITYEGRKQGPTLYVKTDEEAKQMASEYIAQKRKEFGEAFSMIYPKQDAWEVKFV